MLLPGLHPLATIGLLAATAAKKPSGGSSFFLIFIVIVAGVYLLFIAPQRRKQRAQLNQQRSFEVGDEVVTTGGIYGRVQTADGDRVAVDISEGVVIEVARTAIARRVDPATSPTVADPDDEADETPDPAWSAPEAADAPATNGTGANGTAAAAGGDWADPWAAPPADGEKGASGGSS